jgi:4-hydroxyphenylpyruvate dioxygenase
VRAANRAAALLSARYEAPIGPNEQRMPTIIAPGGLLVHFVPESLGATGQFDIDFVRTAEGEAADTEADAAGLQRIDHVALGRAVDRLDTWVLFCRAVLGLAVGDSLELADPFGLIRSCGVANADRSLRLVLNMSLSRSTRTARAVSASGGCVVHHIALACGDIFATVDRLRQNGVAFVPISPNYHDDLPTRFELDEPLVERLRRHGILFDRTADGDYFQVYTESHADRFFFELVQRVDRYDAYGALNAPARMAAQAQQAERASASR